MDEVAAGVLVALELQQPVLLRLEEQVAEGAESVGALIEAWMLTLDRLLHARAVNERILAALRPERVERFHQEVERFLDGRTLVFFLGDFYWCLRGGGAGTLPCRLGPHQVVVVEKFVAVIDEQIRGGT